MVDVFRQITNKKSPISGFWEREPPGLFQFFVIVYDDLNWTHSYLAAVNFYTYKHTGNSEEIY